MKKLWNRIWISIARWNSKRFHDKSHSYKGSGGWYIYGRMDGIYVGKISASMGIDIPDDLMQIIPAMAEAQAHKHQVGNWNGFTWVPGCPACAVLVVRVAAQETGRLRREIEDLQIELREANEDLEELKGETKTGD